SSLREEFSDSDATEKATSSPTLGSSTAKAKPRSEESMDSVEIESETPLPENRRANSPTEDNNFRLRCKKCGRKLRVNKSRAGQRIKCPKCENRISVPGHRDLSTDDAAPSPNEMSFTALARQLGAPPQQTNGDSDTEGAKAASPSKKSLSGRKYRKLTKVLEEKGLQSSQKLSERADALRELGQSGDSRAYEWLATDLDHNELQVRQAAAVGLGELGDPQAVPLFVALLDDRSMVMRKAALLGLGKTKDSRCVKPILLYGLNDPQMKFLASEAIMALGEVAVPALIELLEDQELGVVLEAIVLLGRIKDPRARRALMGVIDARQPLLQCHAIEALGQIGDTKSIGPLSRLLQSSNANVRASAAAALSKMASDKNVVAPLVQALDDPDEDVVVQAANGLGETGVKRAAEPLSKLLRSPHENVRVAAAQAMGALGDQRAVPHLMTLLDVDSQDVSLKVLTTLRAMKVPHISGELLKRLDSPNAKIRRRVVDALAPMGDGEVAEK
ncbi:MAG: HEAT repeat domain-containing protein, partial [Planctomycetaceae bacterium]|nr:HEAT repeat domain-containing protein [Planctomycetaceae bacterium]